MSLSVQLVLVLFVTRSCSVYVADPLLIATFSVRQLRFCRIL